MTTPNATDDSTAGIDCLVTYNAIRNRRRRDRLKRTCDSALATRPTDLFSPPSPLPAAHSTPARPTAAGRSEQTVTSASGELTPPASPTPPSVFVDAEPETPRKRQPRPAFFPHSPSPFSDLPLHRMKDGPSGGHGKGSDGTSQFDTASFPIPPLQQPAISSDSSPLSSSHDQYSAKPSSKLARPARIPRLYSVPNAPLPAPFQQPPTLPSSQPPLVSPILPSIQLVRTSAVPIHPGDSFSFTLRAFNFLPSLRQSHTFTLTFSGTSRIRSGRVAGPSMSHQLFRLEAQVVLGGPLWSGSISVPASCVCATCDHEGEVPWTFHHQDPASGGVYDTAFLLEAAAGDLRASLEIDVLPRLKVPTDDGWERWQAPVDHVTGSLRGLKLQSIELAYKHPRLSPPDLTFDCPLLLETSLLFRRSPVFSPISLAALLAALSSLYTTVTLVAVLIVAGNEVVLPLGGSWSSSSPVDEFRLKVDAVAADTLVVTVRLPVIPKALVFSDLTSCAGFAVGFSVHVHIGSANHPAGQLHLEAPFLSSPRSPSSYVPLPAFPTSRITTADTSAETTGKMPEPHLAAVVKRVWHRLRRMGMAMRRRRLRGRA